MSEPRKPEPVHVIESIPVAGEHQVTPGEAQRDGIPLPQNLRIFRELARGGMGRIHPATDRSLLRHVALKRLAPEYAKVPFYRDGFIAEAQMTGQLEHPNIVPVHELGISPAGVPYFTMKLVQGISLHRWLQQPAHAVGSSERLEGGLEILMKVCDAVAYAHHRGVIHRDLKPENVMVAEFGQVYLMDWGLARLTRSKPASGADAQMAAPGPVGTPGYMAPEQARGVPHEMDERSDIFGLGALLYEIVSGKLPCGDDPDTDALLARTARGDVTPIEEATAGMAVSKGLCQIVSRAVHPDPKKRYATVEALHKDLKAFVRGGLHLARKTFEPGQQIIREGDVGDSAYMIVSGRCRAFRDVDGTQETLTVMTAGDVFGEMALLLEEPRAASVEAVDTVTVLVLDKQTMTEGLGMDGWTGALVRALAQRFRNLEHQVRESGMRRG